MRQRRRRRPSDALLDYSRHERCRCRDAMFASAYARCSLRAVNAATLRACACRRARAALISLEAHGEMLAIAGAAQGAVMPRGGRAEVL